MTDVSLYTSHADIYSLPMYIRQRDAVVFSNCELGCEPVGPAYAVKAYIYIHTHTHIYHETTRHVSPTCLHLLCHIKYDISYVQTCRRDHETRLRYFSVYLLLSCRPKLLCCRPAELLFCRPSLNFSVDLQRDNPKICRFLACIHIPLVDFSRVYMSHMSMSRVLHAALPMRHQEVYVIRWQPCQ